MSAAHKSESPAATGQNAEKSTNTATVSPADFLSNDQKRLATLKARFAISGFAVHDLADGGFAVCRWNLAQFCPDLAALAGFARRTGVQS